GGPVRGCRRKWERRPAAKPGALRRLSFVLTTATSEEAAKPSQEPPPPRTLPQAFLAYLRCLCYGPPPAKSAQAPTAEPESSKNPPAEGTPSGNPGRKDSDIPPRNGKPESSKNPPAEGSPPDSTNRSGSQPSGRTDEPQPSKNPPAEEKKSSGNGNGNGKESEKDKENGKAEWYSAHAQATVVTQEHYRFRSPYVGPNSLVPDEPTAISMTGTVYLDVRLWERDGNAGELVFNPEIAGGRGLSSTTGIAGFPNGEITRVGLLEPTPYLARLYLRQTIGFGGEQEQVEDSPNQRAGK